MGGTSGSLAYQSSNECGECHEVCESTDNDYKFCPYCGAKILNYGDV